jgi:predicted enzyme related to lactoylglutathione lyase
MMPLKRVIVFVGDVEKCAGFYRDAFGFTVVPSDQPPKEWLELDTGGCRLAFHKARGAGGAIDSPTGGPTTPHKVVFYAEDVAAARAELVGRGVKMGKVNTFGKLAMCDGRDPEGHAFQISNRT